MLGATLSRWTMSYFAAALAALLLGEGLMAAGFGFPAAAIRAPETLVLVHVTVVGWLSLLMCGALLQFVPVLVARPLHSDRLALPALVLLLAGLGMLLAGFLQLAGSLASVPSLLPYAATSLAAGFALVLYNLGRTLWRARPLPLPARFVAVALLSLGVTVAFGSLFGAAFAMPIASETLLAIAGNGLALHVAAGIGGWLTFAAMGVSYRLLAMFMLAPEPEGARPRAVFRLGTAALAVTAGGGVAAVLLDLPLAPVLMFGAVLGVIALALYGADMVGIYRARKRRVIELNSRMASIALISLAASVVLALVLAVLGRFVEQIGAVAFLFVFGWLTGLGLSKLYKIVAFVTWLECYGPVLGKTPTPRVQDLVVEPRARKWFLLYYLATWGATLALLGAHGAAFRIAAGVMMAATIGIAAQLLRARLLSDVAAEKRMLDGVRRPYLLIACPHLRGCQ
ncbi:hypothetical protein ACUSIJ_05765 [Pseudochelatococcus sp. B33]